MAGLEVLFDAEPGSVTDNVLRVGKGFLNSGVTHNTPGTRSTHTHTLGRVPVVVVVTPKATDEDGAITAATESPFAITFPPVVYLVAATDTAIVVRGSAAQVPFTFFVA